MTRIDPARYETAERRIAELVAAHPERSFDEDMENIAHLAAQRFGKSDAPEDSIRLEWSDRGDAQIVGVAFGGFADADGEIITKREVHAATLAAAIMHDIYIDIENAVGAQNATDEAQNRIEDAIYRSLATRSL